MPPVMSKLAKPARRPACPNFSSGPCAKRPGWTPDVLRGALVGRSHRSAAGVERLKLAVDLTRSLLEIPEDHRLGIVPGSDTGAFEMALWSLLGARGVDVLAWEHFGNVWLVDIVTQLQVSGARVLTADYGYLPDLTAVDFDRDVVFAWNGTASGVRVPNGDWIPADRRGLTFADATSALCAQYIDWSKIDVATFSWQKIIGGEAAHGMIVLSPRAVERLKTHIPAWPVPKLFRLAEGGQVMEEIFAGVTINTPSMLCVEDYIDALTWGRGMGGRKALQERVEANAAVLFDWIERTPWIANLAVEPATRSNTSVCMRLTEFPQSIAMEAAVAGRMVATLAENGVAYDIGAYRAAPPGLRIWCGTTIEQSDLEALVPWLDWAYAEARAALG
jgi:phosphoserine aminotransferase